MEFEWDSEKATANAKKHGVEFVEAMTVFGSVSVLCLPSSKLSYQSKIEAVNIAPEVRVADRRTKIQVPGIAGTVDAVEVGVEEATERWTDIKLTDGSQIRLKAVVLGVVRVEGHYDPEGNPFYQIKANQVMTVTAPDQLKKGAEGAGGSKAH